MDTMTRPTVLSAFAAALVAVFAPAPVCADITPQPTAAATRQAIQDAIDAAGPSGSVTLGIGLFQIDTQLMVTNGITLKGQGWDNTIIMQTAATAAADKRVMTIDGGSTVEHLTMTGGKSAGGAVGNNYQYGGGAWVKDGTISWCCITNNELTTGNTKYGGGVGFGNGKGMIDHSIIADNYVSVVGGEAIGGGGIGVYQPSGSVVIDACLVLGNRSVIMTNGEKKHSGRGGGIGIDLVSQNWDVTIRNTTIVGNAAGEEGGAGGLSKGGAIFAKNDSKKPLAMLNCIVAGNTTVNGGATVELSYPDNVDYCLFDVADDRVGDHSLVGDPQFVDAANRDYRLDEESVAIRAGTAYENLGRDLGNEPFHVPPSLGCYEYTGEMVVVRPVFSPAPGTMFYPSLGVALSCRTDGAAIYYTTGDSDPTDESTPYTAPIPISSTTTIKARAYKAGMNPSRVVEATFTRGQPTPPELGEVTVSPRATSATVSGEIVSLGNNVATACDVYLAFSKRPNNLGASKKIVSGATTSFTYVIPDLEQETTYYYELKVQNNAQIPMNASVQGSFTTTALGIRPIVGDAAATRSLIQTEIDAANLTDPAGTVYLASGLFEIDTQLMVTGGVTLVGRGMDRTIIKQTATTAGADKRVMTIDGGSTVEHLTITGGKVTGGNEQIGGGALVLEGTISWCCITNNKVTGNNTKYGGGVGFAEGPQNGHARQIDHSIVANNLASTEFGDQVGGGGIGVYKPFGPVTVESCLVWGNRSVTIVGDHRKNLGRGGGIGIDFATQNSSVTIRNTTIAGNSAGEEGGPAGGSEGGSIYTANDTKNKLTMRNCLVGGNTTVGTNITVKLSYAGDVDYCLFDIADDKIGEHSKVGAAKFVDLAKGNCHLSPDSAAVGVALWEEDMPVDLDGLKRRRRPAAGCYEVKAGTLLIIR